MQPSILSQTVGSIQKGLSKPKNDDEIFLQDYLNVLSDLDKKHQDGGDLGEFLKAENINKYFNDEDEKLSENDIECFLEKKKKNGLIHFKVKFKDEDVDAKWIKRTHLVQILGLKCLKKIEKESNLS